LIICPKAVGAHSSIQTETNVAKQRWNLLADVDGCITHLNIFMALFLMVTPFTVFFYTS
jgi:hypothetical protein